MNRNTTALLAVLVVAGCGGGADAGADRGPERVEAWQTVEGYKIDQRMDVVRVGEWLRQPGNEGGTREDAEAALGLRAPDPLPAMEAALGIAGANPTDDLGYLALNFAFYELRSVDGDARHEYEDAVYGLLESHYIDDLRLDRMLLGLVRFGGERGVDLVDRVVAESRHRLLRARGAFWSATERLIDVDDLKSSPDERARVRSEVAHMARLVADEYSDVVVFRGESGGEAIAPVLYALDNLTIGSVLPDATAQRIGGGRESLGQYRGSVLLLDFWATWCVPCIASLPDVERLQRVLGDHGFQVITISIDERVDLVDEFMDRRMDLPYVNWFVGPQSELYDSWAIPAVPTYIVVDRDGVVRGRTHDLESLYDAILDATGADAEARAEVLGG